MPSVEPPCVGRAPRLSQVDDGYTPSSNVRNVPVSSPAMLTPTESPMNENELELVTSRVIGTRSNPCDGNGDRVAQVEDGLAGAPGEPVVPHADVAAGRAGDGGDPVGVGDAAPRSEPVGVDQACPAVQRVARDVVERVVDRRERAARGVRAVRCGELGGDDHSGGGAAHRGRRRRGGGDREIGPGVFADHDAGRRCRGLRAGAAVDLAARRVAGLRVDRAADRVAVLRSRTSGPRPTGP